MASYVGEIQNGKLKKYSGAPPAKLKVTTKATIIGTGVFAAKKSLTEVLLHDSVTEIGDSAFESCQNLKKVLLPNGLKRIGYAAFANCSQLCDLDLPDSLEEIGAYAFFSTSWLNQKTGNVYAGGFLLRAEQNAASIEIEPGTKGIVGGAFDGCTSLTSISIPDSVIFIGDLAFSGGYYMGSQGCESLTEITIPDGVEQIGKNAFTGCYSLRKIRISAETVKRIGDKAIEQAFFVIPDLSWNNKDAFLRCLPMRVLTGEEIDIGELRESFHVCLRKKDIRTRLIGYYLENNEADALGRLLAAQKKIPLEELDEYFSVAEKKNSTLCKAALLEYKNRAYSDSTADKAEQVKLEKQLGVRERTASDWKRVFSYKTKDGKIEIVKYLGTDADVFVPEKIGKNTVTRIGYHAFEWNEALVSVQLPKTVVEIGPIAFMRCTNLVKINLPSSLKVIGYEAFASCPSLTIHASAGSYAEQYAKEHNIPFEAE